MIGEQMRRSRLGARRSRRSVADAVGASEWTIGRMERGDGDGVAMRRWAAVADALGWGLTVGLKPAERHESTGAGAGAGPVQRVLTAATVERFSRGGGWTLTSFDERVAVVDRAARAERLVVYLCDRPIEVLDAAEDQEAARTDPTRVPPPSWRQASMTIIRAELRDRYRAMDRLGDDVAAFQTTGAQTIAAVRNPRVALPDGDVIVWCDARATRLIPFGLVLEPGRRAPRHRRPTRASPAA